MKKGFKALLSVLLAGLMVFALDAFGGGSSDSGEETADASAEQGKVLNIWCLNDEVQSRFNDYYPGVKEVAEDKSTTT
ncbi:MAG: carbohydrate ABC transporter substrate-binding protein, partial [Mogibacterium sp.]|nr:carbohydrate ABC transporter substrate-binding protein [Mogibacterium sp.]